MRGEARTLRLRYRSRRALSADHAAYWVHGGMLVPVARGEAPPPNCGITIALEGPGGLAFELAGRVGRTAPGQGFLVSFEPEAEPARVALDAALADPAFLAARDAEPESEMAPPEVSVVDDGERGDLAVPGHGAPADAGDDEGSPDTDPLSGRDRFGPDPASVQEGSLQPRRDPAKPEPGLPATGLPATSPLQPTRRPPTDPAPGLPAASSLQPTRRPPTDPAPGLPAASPRQPTQRPPTDPSPGLPATSPLQPTRRPPTDPSPGLPATSPRRPTQRPATEVRGATPQAFSGRRPAPSPDRTVIRKPRPGETYLVAVVRYPTVASYMDDAEELESTARLEIEPPERPPRRGAPVRIRLTLPGHNVLETWTVIEEVGSGRVTLRFDADDPSYRRACLYPSSHQARNRQEREEQRSEPAGERTVLWLTEELPEEEEKMPLRRRIKRMGMEDKINLALSGNREERMALAQDSNKSIHHHLLRNAKLTIDEVAFMSRLPSLNPDVLDKIAENPAYTQNPAVTKALVFNPRTPLRTALRLLDRLPRSELSVLSRRTNMNKRLVMAAKNKLLGSKW